MRLAIRSFLERLVSTLKSSTKRDAQATQNTCSTQKQKGDAIVILLVGLGNPDEKSAGHRHNIGFLAVDAIAEAHGFGPARRRFQGITQEGTIDGPQGRVKCMILKPQTYMNESGRSVGEAARFFKIPLSDIIVFHDELDLAPKKLRVKVGGGVAGHNGLKSIAAHIGPEFKRVRIGIGHPGDKNRVSRHVLGDFAKSEHPWRDDLIREVAKAAPLLASGEDAKFMNAVALALNPKTDNKKKSDGEQKNGL